MALVDKKSSTFLRKKKAALNVLASLEQFVASYKPCDHHQLPVRLELANTCKEQFDTAMSEIEEVDESKLCDAGHLQEQSNFYSRYCEVKGSLLHLSKEEATASETSLNATFKEGSSANVHLRLPKIELPSFDGDETKWLTFKDRFVSMIHVASEIPPIMKLQYLLASLKGDAAALFDHTELVADNYAVTWSALIDRYDNKKTLIRKYYKTLTMLPAIKSDRVEELAQLVDEVSRLVKGLKKLGMPIESWNIPLTHLIFLKIDAATIKAYEELKHDSDEYQALMEFLQDRVKTLKSSNQLTSCMVMEVSKVAGRERRTPQPRTFTPNGQAVCYVCKAAHSIYQCTEFAKMVNQKRRDVVSRLKLCFNCLNPGHGVYQCSSRMSCRICNRRHHALLCRDEGNTISANAMASEAATTATVLKDEVLERANDQHKIVLLSTAIVNVVDRYGTPIPARALIDSGSQSNFMSDRLAQQLGMRRIEANVPVSGVGNSSEKVRQSIIAQVKSTRSTYECTLKFLILKKVTLDLPTTQMDITNWKIPEFIGLADPQFNVVGKVDLLIGAEVFLDLLLQETFSLGSNLPSLRNTKIGWLISGPYYAKPSVSVCAVSHEREHNINALMESFFHIEECSGESKWTKEEQECEDLFQRTTVRDKGGKYVVRLPLRSSPSESLGSSRDIAMRRFYANERRLLRDPSVKKVYDDFLQEYLRLNHMSEVQESQEESCVYLPHHPVFKMESSTTKCRVVFDASCKTASGRSLNDILKIGPTIQDDLVTILLRFRTHGIAVIADVEKMYRQIWVHEEDRRLQRIFWRKSTSEPLRVFELNTVTYGTSSAPYLAIRTLNQTFEDFGDQKGVVESWKHDFYVDDFISGAETEQEAKQMIVQLEEILAKGGFRLRKWASNKPEVLTELSQMTGAESSQNGLVIGESASPISTLGVYWDPRLDVMKIRIHPIDNNKRITKRFVMTNIARIYDPYGALDPVKMRAKIIMQKIWTLKGIDKRAWNWDDELPYKMQREWVSFTVQWNKLADISFPRQIFMPNSKNIQFHIFCDASQQGYGACAYVRCADDEFGIVARLWISKSKVAPLSQKLTIAKLELCAAVLGSRVYELIRNAWKGSYKCFMWTDSMTVGHWIHSEPSRWKIFVANRVSKLQQSTKECTWRYVPGTLNPADIVSRGCKPEQLAENCMWQNGPLWLSESEDKWPAVVPFGKSVNNIPEQKCLVLVSVKNNREDHHLFSRFSSWMKLRRVTAIWMKYFRLLRGGTHTGRWITTDDLNAADRALCRLAQGDEFCDELKALKRGERVSNRSALKWFNSTLGEDNVMRIGGRLGNSAENQNVKHPIIVPGNHPLAQLIVRHYHVMLLHAGPQLLLSTIRQRFWIVRGRNVVKRIVHECHTCFRCKPALTIQPMAELPSSRVTEARPFSICGVDYCGPVYVKGAHRRAVATKAYISIFVCFVTRAVHIELVSNLTTEAFVAALRRFVGRRGLVAEIHSDNATNFKGAANELRKAYQLLQSIEHREEVQRWATMNGIKWKFIPPRAPHFGGLWEAAVKSTKHHLLRVLGTTSLTFEDMSTLLVEVESCLNSRPITPLSDDPMDVEALTGNVGIWNICSSCKRV